jgi:hypothetical protein
MPLLNRNTMRTKSLITTSLVAGLVSFGVPSFAADEPKPIAVAADALIARPLCFAATVIGSVLFVVSLPAAVPSHSVKKAANALVTKPAKATFSRPLGDFENMKS